MQTPEQNQGRRRHGVKPLTRRLSLRVRYARPGEGTGQGPEKQTKKTQYRNGLQRWQRATRFRRTLVGVKRKNMVQAGMILVGFDRASIPMHAGELTREGLGHAGVILFRRSVSAIAYGKQARLLVDLWREAKDWEWADRIEYLPRS
jgi:hypothetical protein